MRSYCSCHKLTGGHKPGLFERLLMKAIPHFDIIKTIKTLCPYCVLDCDFCKGEEVELTVPYLRRFFLFRSKWIGMNFGDVYLHHIMRSDDDPDPHDHPWGFAGFILKGGYTDEQWLWIKKGQIGPPSPNDEYPFWYEYLSDRRVGPWLEEVKPLTFIRRVPEHTHRVLVPKGKTAWTLIFTSGRSRDWSFLTKKGPVNWRKYLGIPDDVDVGE